MNSPTAISSDVTSSDVHASDVGRSASRRAWAAVFLAVLVGASVVGWRVASGNFAVVDPVKNPRILELFADLPGDEFRTQATRYVINESNRSLFRFAGPTQLGCLAVALFLFLSASRLAPQARDRWIRRLLILVVVLSVATTASIPYFVDQGRANDFVSRVDGDPPQVKTWKRFHGAYMATDLLKVIGAAALIPLLIASLRPRDPTS